VVRVVAIQFNHAGKMYDFNAGEMDLKPGDRVVVDTERGAGLGMVVAAPVEKDPAQYAQPLAMVRRLMTPEDEQTQAHHARREQEAREFCLRRIKERGMEMKLVRVEYLFDGSKAIFYFTADGRVDFRELVKDLAHTFHTRIEMRQIGVRDESKMVGGLGICGRELCCASFLRDFQPVSVKMAKEQNLALNPTKISGQCGRLLCCLDYEYEAYCELRKNFPKCGKRACTVTHCGTVEKMNLLTGELTLRQGDGKLVSVHVNELVDESRLESPPKSPATDRDQQPNDRRDRDQQAKQQHHKQRQPQQQSSKPVPASQEQPAATAQTVSKTAEQTPSDEQKPKRKRPRNRRHGHRKPNDKKPDVPTQE
jgi:cell fate regulator YaaT (PSP1 superfamily)